MLGDIHKDNHSNHKGIIIAYPSFTNTTKLGENISGHGFYCGMLSKYLLLSMMLKIKHHTTPI
jgi:hypothetical protein